MYIPRKFIASLYIHMHSHTHKTRMYAQSSKTMKGCTHLGCDCYHEDEVLVCFKEHLNFKTLVY